MSPIFDGQPVEAATTNPVYLDKTQDDATVGRLDLNNGDAPSGPSVTNLQREVNSLDVFTGRPAGSAFNATPSWTNNDVGLSTDSVKTRADNLTQKFNLSAGHAHDGTAGNGKPIGSVSISGTSLMGFFIQGTDLIGITGTSTSVTSQLTGNTPSTSPTVQGIVTNTPYNKVFIRQASGSFVDDGYEDGSGNIVYGRVTESAGSWTLSFYVEIAGVETAYNFTGASDIRWYYQKLFNPITNSPVYDPAAFIPSDNTTADILTATTSIQGKVSLASASQSVGSTNGGGTANASVANENHTHQGVHSIAKSGDTALFSDVTVSAGSGITLTQVGQNIQIANSAASGISGFIDWIEDEGSPIASIANHIRVYAYQSGLTQQLYAVFKVPTNYSAGSQIRLRSQFYSPDSSGTALMRSQSTLIRTGTDVISSTTNQRTSTNAAVTLTGATVNKPQALSLDLTDSSGLINAVAVSAGDLINIRLYRDTDTATSDIQIPSYASEVTL